MLQGFDEYLARGAEEALGEDCTCGRDDLEVYGRLGEPAEHDDGCPIWEKAKAEIACVGTCTCGAECLIVAEKPKPKYEFYSAIWGNKLGEI